MVFVVELGEPRERTDFLREVQGSRRGQELGWEINFWAGPPREGSMS